MHLLRRSRAASRASPSPTTAPAIESGLSKAGPNAAGEDREGFLDHLFSSYGPRSRANGQAGHFAIVRPSLRCEDLLQPANFRKLSSNGRDKVSGPLRSFDLHHDVGETARVLDVAVLKDGRLD